MLLWIRPWWKDILRIYISSNLNFFIEMKTQIEKYLNFVKLAELSILIIKFEKCNDARKFKICFKIKFIKWEFFSWIRDIEKKLWILC